MKGYSVNQKKVTKEEKTIEDILLTTKDERDGDKMILLWGEHPILI